MTPPPAALDCTCGVYAAKSREHLRQLGYEGRGIRGEVHLWGTGRAQFAYPKSLVLPSPPTTGRNMPGSSPIRPRPQNGTTDCLFPYGFAGLTRQ